MAGSSAETGGWPPARVSGVGDTLREQSTSVLALVVVAAVFGALGAGAVVVLSDSGDSGTDPPQANLRVDISGDTVTVAHVSGDTVAAGELGVTLLVDGERSELDLLAFDEQPADPGQFAPGEQFADSDGPYAGNVTVFVVHEPTDTRLVDTTVGVDRGLDLTLDAVTDADGGPLRVGDRVAVEFSLAAETTAASPVQVSVDGETVFDETVTVEAGTVTTETVTTAADLTDGLDVTVTTDGDSLTETLAAPSLAVEFTDVPDTAPADVGYLVENTGDIGVEQTVTLASVADGSVRTETSRTEQVSGSETVTGTFPAVDARAGGKLELSSADSTASVALEESEFRVVSVDVPAEAVAGDEVTVGYEVENAGGFGDTQNVTLTVGGAEVGRETSVTLAPGATASGTFTYATSPDSVSATTVAVGTADDTAEAEIPVTTPGEAMVSVSAAATNSPVMAGGALSVTAAVTNAGQQPGTETVTLTVPGLGTDTTTLTVEGGATVAVTLSVGVGADAAGNYTGTLSTADSEDTVEVLVTDGDDPGAVFDVVAFEVPAEIDPGASLPVSYEVENTGDGEGTRDIALLVDGTEVETTGVTLAGGETFGETFDYDTSAGAGGSLTVEVSTGDDSASRSVQLSGDTPGGDLVASLSTEQGAVGDTVSVDLNVVSAGDGTRPFGSYTVVLSYDDSVLEFQGISPGKWGSPATSNANNNLIAVADFMPSGSTPAEPALSFEFEIVNQGTAAVEFTDTDAVPGKNRINDGVGDPYDTTFENGAVQAD